MCSSIQHKIKEEEEKLEDAKFLQLSDSIPSFSSQEQNLF